MIFRFFNLFDYLGPPGSTKWIVCVYPIGFCTMSRTGRGVLFHFSLQKIRRESDRHRSLRQLARMCYLVSPRNGDFTEKRAARSKLLEMLMMFFLFLFVLNDFESCYLVSANQRALQNRTLYIPAFFSLQDLVLSLFRFFW